MAVPGRLIWDNETCIGRRNSYAAEVGASAEVLATRIVQVNPIFSARKGVVERVNQFLKTSLLPAESGLSLPGGPNTSGQCRRANPSVHPQAVGRFIQATGDLETVTISLDRRSVGIQTRSWGPV